VLISIQELEHAINYWRTQAPASGEEKTLCPQAALLAKPYALMIYHRQSTLDSSLLSTEAEAALRTAQSAPLSKA
jgi:hypothetical protein